MSEILIKKIDTASGPKRIDYNALANLPDLSSIGVQADWNENDETAKSHILNRTHYIAKDGTVKRLDPMYLPTGVVTDITITPISGGHRITLTTNTSSSEIDVMDGTTPSIGDDGKWYLGETNTGVSASGLQANANWDQDDENAVDYIRNKPNVKKDYLILTDIADGTDYGIQMMNGSLISEQLITGIEITTPPTKTEYVRGQKFDPSGMVVTAIKPDGSNFDLTDYVYQTEPFMVVGENIEFEITYTKFGRTYKSSPILITVTEFVPEVELVDFGYNTNTDGSYTLTSWRGTTDGTSSTELVVPDNTLIVV